MIKVLNNSVVSGLSLILFLIFSEPIPLGKTLSDTPRFFTAHLFLNLLPTSILRVSSLFFLIPSLIFFIIAFLPIMRHGLKLFPLLLILLGLIFYPMIYFIPNAVNAGYLWGILFFILLGTNLWFKDWNYFYASTVGLLFWDMGAGIQGIIFSIPQLPEPYGNNIPPIFVVVIDSLGVMLAGILWIRHLKRLR